MTLENIFILMHFIKVSLVGYRTLSLLFLYFHTHFGRFMYLSYLTDVILSCSLWISSLILLLCWWLHRRLYLRLCHLFYVKYASTNSTGISCNEVSSIGGGGPKYHIYSGLFSLVWFTPPVGIYVKLSLFPSSWVLFLPSQISLSAFMVCDFLCMMVVMFQISRPVGCGIVITQELLSVQVQSVWYLHE